MRTVSLHEGRTLLDRLLENSVSVKWCLKTGIFQRDLPLNVACISGCLGLSLAGRGSLSGGRDSLSGGRGSLSGGRGSEGEVKEGLK